MTVISPTFVQKYIGVFPVLLIFMLLGGKSNVKSFSG